MSNLENRVKKLEQRLGADKSGAIIVCLRGESETETEAEQRAITEYKAKYPDWQPSHGNTLIYYPNDDEGAVLIQKVIDGVKPEVLKEG